MATKFSQLNNVGAITAGDTVVGLRAGLDVQFTAPSLPVEAWSTITVSQPLLINQGYFIASGVPTSFALPTVAAVGQLIQVIISTTAAITFTQGAGQQVLFANNFTTLGVGGSFTSTAIGDSFTLICNTANLGFESLNAPQGIWIVI